MTAGDKAPCLLILLGASDWPEYTELTGSPAFGNAAQEVKDYFTQYWGLEKESILDLFDSPLGADDLDEAIGKFLTRATKQTPAPKDVICYFIGHGGFFGEEKDFLLAIRATREDSPAASSVSPKHLAYTIRRNALVLRRFIILDCCFSASAVPEFMGAIGQVVAQALDEIPTAARGTAMLCSSSRKQASRLLPDGSNTAFTESLINLLRSPERFHKERLSFRDVYDLLEIDLTAKRYPHPELHTVERPEGDISRVPLFPKVPVPPPARERATQSETSEATVAKEPNSDLEAATSVKEDEPDIPPKRPLIEQIKTFAGQVAPIGYVLLITAFISWQLYDPAWKLFQWFSDAVTTSEVEERANRFEALLIKAINKNEPYPENPFTKDELFNEPRASALVLARNALQNELDGKTQEAAQMFALSLETQWSAPAAYGYGVLLANRRQWTEAEHYLDGIAIDTRFTQRGYYIKWVKFNLGKPYLYNTP